MCDQVICEVPEECTLNPCDVGPNGDGVPCGEQNLPQCDPYPPRCEPCQAPTDFTPCPPNQSCDCRCDCGDYSGCCYQQPPRVKPIHPAASIFRSTAPLDTDTIYKRSYMGNCGDGFRSKPVYPCHNITTVKAPMEKCTVQKLSYMPHCGTAKVTPILPRDNGLKFNGPLYAMTSQKHDYVPKGFSKRQPIKPQPAIYKACGPIECCTINKLSFMPVDVCKNPPRKPILPQLSIEKSLGPSEKCTIQKLSYLPVCLPPKEPMPWAEKQRHAPPNYDKKNLCTTYNLSYIPNCNSMRVAPITPSHGLKFLGTDRNNNNTVYKLSYIGGGGCRPEPVRPVPALEMPKGPMEKCTIQKLSYQPNCYISRTMPIRPKENGIKAVGPIYSMTTQKHDFVPKPICRRIPIRPISAICRPTGGLEKCTINKLSYMPVNICEYRPPMPILPKPNVFRAEGPMEKCTTYKLSYLPNCMPPKEPMPWAKNSNYIKPTTPMEKCTVQKLSYGPPGTFLRCGGCCNNNSNSYPKTGVCN